MNNSWHSYPKVYALGHPQVRDMFFSDVIIQEKVDGSQISFGVIDGVLKVKSKSQELILDEPEKMFVKAVEVILSVKDKLVPGYTYRGEYLQKPKHNTLCYDRTPVNHIALFDINDDCESYLSYDDAFEEAEKIGLEMVPLLYRGKVSDPTVLPDMISKVSFLGGNDMEGIVVKNYAMFGNDKKVLMAKFVSEKFKEIHNKNWKESNPGGKDIIQLIIADLKTEARWRKAVQHLKERGVLEGSPKDIANLMREMDADVKEECSEHISEKLMNWALPNVLRGVKGGLPEWYKRFLVEEAYGDDK